MSRALLIFAEGSEELEAVTIVNLLRRGGVEVLLAGLTPGALRGSRGTALLPDCALDEALMQEFDMVILPGGQPGTRSLQADPRVIRLVQKMAAQGHYVAAICAAPMVLASAGLLAGKRAVCYPGCLEAFPDVFVQGDAVVEDGKVITSRGPGTAMDFALLLLERLAGVHQRRSVEASLVR